MTEGRQGRMPERSEGPLVFRETAPNFQVPNQDGLDLSLLEDSLAKTPWERMRANDDALNFAESLRAAMEKRNGKS